MVVIDPQFNSSGPNGKSETCRAPEVKDLQYHLQRLAAHRRSKTFSTIFRDLPRTGGQRPSVPSSETCRGTGGQRPSLQPSETCRAQGSKTFSTIFRDLPRTGVKDLRYNLRDLPRTRVIRLPYNVQRLAADPEPKSFFIQQPCGVFGDAAARNHFAGIFPQRII